MAQKLSTLVQVRMSPGMAAKLRAIAEGKGVEAAELLRYATAAIIDCHTDTGDVPLDMAIRQRTRRGWIDDDILKAAEDAADEDQSPTKPKKPKK